MINHARYFFSELGFDKLDIIETKPEYTTHSATIKGFDIVSDGTELGSYGIRECKFLT